MKRTLAGSIALSLVGGLASAQNATPPGNSRAPDTAPHAATSAMVDLRTVDTNMDGRISLAEVQSHSELKTSFATLDADSDGYLSRSEYAKWNKAAKDSTATPPASSRPDTDSRATPAQPATPARPGAPGEPATPAVPATPANPAR